MHTDIRYKPAFATLFVTLAPGESILAEADAMASMSGNIRMRTRFNGGFFRAILRRIFGKESLFVNEFYCPPGTESGHVVLTQSVPGDIHAIQLRGTTLYLQPSAYVASGPGVTLGLGWAGIASWLSGEGLFRLKVSGDGPVWIGAYGAVYERTIDDVLIIDSGHLVAYEPTLAFRVRMAGGLFSSLFGGEGLVNHMHGRGRVYLQSRNMSGLVAWTNQYL